MGWVMVKGLLFGFFQLVLQSHRRSNNLITFSAYCNTLEMMINEKIEALLALREKARNFKESLVDEDAKSRLLTRRN